MFCQSSQHKIVSASLLTLSPNIFPLYTLQNFIATIASTQLSRFARDEADGGSSKDNLETMDKVISFIIGFWHDGSLGHNMNANPPSVLHGLHTTCICIKTLIKNIFWSKFILTEDEFESVYKYATLEPHNCLFIDTNPTTHKDQGLRNTLIWFCRRLKLGIYLMI